MDDQGQLGLLGGLDMDAEGDLLNLGAIGGVVIVEARLSQADEFGVFGVGHQLLDGDSRVFGGAHRVDACGVEDALISLGNGADQRLFFQLGADRDHAGDTGGAGAGDYGVQFAVEIGEVEVAVAVDKFEGGGQFGCGMSICHVTSARHVPPSHRPSEPYP
jgi:hypothetical protein